MRADFLGFGDFRAMLSSNYFIITVESPPLALTPWACAPDPCLSFNLLNVQPVAENPRP